MTVEWAIVLATFIGPFFAIIVAEIIRNRSDKKQRQYAIFRSLMSSRRVGLSHEHVSALNLIEVEFYKNKNVISAWSNYLDHLNANQNLQNSQDWNDKRDHLLALLLERISGELGFKFESMQLFRGGYAPMAWANSEKLQLNSLNAITGFAKGEIPIPIKILHD